MAFVKSHVAFEERIMRFEWNTCMRLFWKRDSWRYMDIRQKLALKYPVGSAAQTHRRLQKKNEYTKFKST